MKKITFFSFKGGSGRTSLLYNTLPFLANELKASPEEPIVVIDLDIDSKGLSLLFEGASFPNTIQLLQENYRSYYIPLNGKSIQEHKLFRNMLPIGQEVGLPFDKDRSILFVSVNPTGTEEEKEKNKNLVNGSYDLGISKLGAFIEYCEKIKKCKAIIMDSPAGLQMAGQKALKYSSDIVTVMRITKQFKLGTKEFFEEISKTISNRNFILIPNAVPDPEGTNYSYKSIFTNIKNMAQNSLKNNNLNLHLLEDDNYGVNEVKIFKFQETNLHKKKKLNFETVQPDELQAMEMYKKVAKEILYGEQ